MRAPSIALLVTLLVTPLFPARPGLAQYWSPATNIYPQDVYDEWGPSMAVAPDGTAWIVWGIEPWYSHWTSEGWAPPERLAPTGDGLAHRWPVLGCAPDGAMWAVWEADVSYRTFYGLTSRWTGAAWSPPETLWVSTSPASTQYDLAPVSGNEAWFIRPSSYPGYTVEAIHLMDGDKTSYPLFVAGGGAGQPSIVVDRDGVVWAAWNQRPSDPYALATSVYYSRFENGSWETPQPATGSILLNRFGMVAGSDNSKWIVTHEEDSRFGLLENTWGRRWNGSAWDSPVLISESIDHPDTVQAQLTLSRGGCGNPAATWIRSDLYSRGHSEVMVTVLRDGAWSYPIVTGRPVDSEYKRWPGVAASDTSIWVAYMQSLPPVWVSNILTTHTIPAPSLDGIAEFTAEARGPGIRLSWSMSRDLGATVARVYRADASYGIDQVLPPSNSVVVDEEAAPHAAKGSTLDRLRSAPGTYSYWLTIETADAVLGWLGPRTASFGGAAMSREAPGLEVRIAPAGSGVSLRMTGGGHEASWASIFDVSGRLVHRVRLEARAGSGGTTRLQGVWDGTNASGLRVASGVYFARPELRGMTGRATATKFVLIR